MCNFPMVIINCYIFNFQVFDLTFSASNFVDIFFMLWFIGRIHNSHFSHKKCSRALVMSVGCAMKQRTNGNAKITNSFSYQCFHK